MLATGTSWAQQSHRTLVTDHGIVANTPSAATTNQAALRKLVSPTASGGESTFTGKVTFPNASGQDIYYFSPLNVEVRDDITIDCQGATLSFTGDFDSKNNGKGFLTFVRDVAIENCKIKVDYDGKAGVNNGSALRLGARAGYDFGGVQTKVGEKTLAKPMGGIRVRNVDITTNNPGVPAVLILGGIQDTTLDTISINGADRALGGIYYEFGQWHYVGGRAGGENVTTHALNLRFKNIRVNHVADVGMSLVGAMTASVDGLWVENARTVLVARPGEAGYYNMKGTPTAGMKAHIDLHNINGKKISSTGISMVGSESLLHGYLANDIKALGPDERAKAQTDKITFNLDGFDLADSGIIVNAPRVKIANGTQRHGGARGIWIQSETTNFDFDNIKVLDNSGTGIASDAGGQIYAKPRARSGSIRNCVVAGNGAGGGHNAGIALSQMDGVLIDSCRFGYESKPDSKAESTQGCGVTKQPNARNVTIRRSSGSGSAFDGRCVRPASTAGN